MGGLVVSLLAPDGSVAERITLTGTFDDPINVQRIEGNVAFNFNVNGSDPSAVISNHAFNFTPR